MLWTVGIVYAAVTTLVMCVFWVLDDKNQRWQENLAWALAWPCWIVLWCVALLISLIFIWIVG